MRFAYDAIVAGLVLACIAGCSKEPAPTPPPTAPEATPQSADATLRRIGMEALCYAELRSVGLRVRDEDKDAHIEAWLDRQVAHEAIRRLAFDELPALDPQARARRLDDAAARAGVGPCPLADLWRWRARRRTGGAEPCVEACLSRAMRSAPPAGLAAPSSTTMEQRAECELGCEPARDDEGVLTAPDE